MGLVFPGSIFYVNTAGTVGTQNGSTNTPGNSGNAAFATLNQAINSAATHIAAPRWIRCSGATADTVGVVQTDWNTINSTPANFILITGDNTTGIYNTNNYRMEIADGNAIYNNNPGHVRVGFMQVQLTNTSTSGTETRNGLRLSTQNVGVGRTDCDCRLYGNIVRGVQNGTDPIVAYDNSQYAETNGGLIRLWNNIAYNCTKGYVAVWDQVTNWNNTGFNNAVDDFEDAQVAIGCLAASALGFNSTGTGGGLSNYNASADGSATAGAQSRVNQTFTFVNSGAGNFQLANNDGGARGFGVNNPASGLFLDDIRGVARQTAPTAWDIGAWLAAT